MAIILDRLIYKCDICGKNVMVSKLFTDVLKSMNKSLHHELHLGKIYISNSYLLDGEMDVCEDCMRNRETDVKNLKLSHDISTIKNLSSYDVAYSKKLNKILKGENYE